MLFQTVRAPQYPDKCILPSFEAKQNRHPQLRERTFSQKDAEEACRRARDFHDRERCVYDLLAMNDLDMAENF
jgi:hypothetical protein